MARSLLRRQSAPHPHPHPLFYPAQQSSSETQFVMNPTQVRNLGVRSPPLRANRSLLVQMQVASGNNSDGEREGVKPKVPRRTPMACQFCRGTCAFMPRCPLRSDIPAGRLGSTGRKLKCDGRSTCANCQRRSIPCVYVPVYVLCLAPQGRASKY